MNNTYIYLLFFTVLNASCQSTESYYTKCYGLTGDSLKSTLHKLIKNNKEYPYTSKNIDVWDILKESDQDTTNQENVICVYSGKSVKAENEYPTWEREHVWSQSHGKFGRSQGAGTDVHHLKPVLHKLNAEEGKANRDFAEGGNEIILKSGDSTNSYVTKNTFEPRDEVKGDIARIMFYMAVRYEKEDGYDLELTNSITTNKKTPLYGNLNTLLKWHKQDPVSSFELNRNNVIYNFQHNRNPFIDHPEWVELIW